MFHKSVYIQIPLASFVDGYISNMQYGETFGEILARRQTGAIHAFGLKFLAIAIEKSHQYIVPCPTLDFFAMALYLVRHAKAGKQSQWDGPDFKRPLDDAGRLQAKALADKIAPVGPTRLVSSPFLRCMQTLADLGELTGLPVLADDRLAEAREIDPIIQMLEHASDGAVLCSHGDIIPPIIRTLECRGMTITTKPDWRKASVWVIERIEMTFTTAAAWPPPSTG